MNKITNKRFTAIPLTANAWITKKGSKGSVEVIDNNGLGNWTSNETIISVYFYIKIPQKLDLFIMCKVMDGKSEISVTIENDCRKIKIEGIEYQKFNIGQFDIKSKGYVKVDLKGVEKTGGYFADVSHLVIGEKTVEKCVQCINDTKAKYWSRRGPSVHLWYNLPINDKHEYYYNEVSVPKGFDPSGSYFMAIGFIHGYFGIQVNSETERLVIYSVWSPQSTDDPHKQTEENRVKLLSKGKNTEIRVFGDEGSGIQTILKYNWETEMTFRFLLRGRPDPNQSTHTIYTAWFAVNNNDWRLISSVKRPKSGEYLSGFYSFVENFDPDFGYLMRKTKFGNQWVYDVKGVWIEVISAKFTGDNTAKSKARLDFDGGIDSLNDHKVFYLRNGGFVEGNTQLLTDLHRNTDNIKPKVNFEKLPQN